MFQNGQKHFKNLAAFLIMDMLLLGMESSLTVYLRIAS